MNSKDAIALKKQILLGLSKRQLKDVFELLMKLSVDIHDWKIADRLNQLETNYKFMLHYLFEGTEDVERDNVYRNLLRSIYELTDDAVDEVLKAESTNVFYEKLRLSSMRDISLNDYVSQLKNIAESIALIDLVENGDEKLNRKRELAVRRERIASDMFNMLFVSDRASDKDLNDYKSFIDHLELPVREKCLFISALTLNLFHRFDAKKVQLLLYATSALDINISSRAMLGLVVVLQMYSIRWSLYPELQSLLDILSENPKFKKDVLRVIIQLIRSHETEKISKKVTEEILPEMMKFNHLAGRKLNMGDFVGETDFADKNPEWQKELEESGLGKKLQEYSSLQMEGADVFHSTFAGLKTFSFFSDLSNWFMPFETSYSEQLPLFPTSDVKNNLLQAAIIDSGHMCNSDKYSFCLSLLQISPNQREMMMGRLGAESEEIKQLQKEAQAINPAIDEDVVSNQYIQDLYRFFKLNIYKNSFFDIFKLSLSFYNKSSIAPLISDTESMRKIAMYLFDKDNFKEALAVFVKLTEKEPHDGDVWQKVGYCKQMLDDMQGALDAYLQADLIKPNNSWILRRIAHIYRVLKQTDLALEYYKKALKLLPDNLSVELNIGHCYLETKDYEQALNTYFKVELLDPKGAKTMRPIAWTALLMQKFDLAQKYYKQILSDKSTVTVHDYLNAGHIELCIDNKKTAIEYYKQAVRLEGSFEQFLVLFEADSDIIVERGVDKNIIPYIFDQIKYTLD